MLPLFSVHAHNCLGGDICRGYLSPLKKRDPWFFRDPSRHMEYRPVHGSIRRVWGGYMSVERRLACGTRPWNTGLSVACVYELRLITVSLWCLGIWMGFGFGL